MKLHLISDVHLEFQDFELPGGEVLVISGDLCEARSFWGNHNGWARQLSFQCKRFVIEELPKYKHVVYVPGNHEFYGRSLNEGRDLLLNAGLPVFSGGSKEIGDFVFYGTTLWTDANRGDPNTCQILSRSMADFHVIEGFSVPKMCEVHAEELANLTEFLAAHRDRKVVVVTHHAPTNKSVNVKYINDWEMNGGFRSELSELIFDNPQIVLWTHGHMHDYVDYMVGTTRVVCNPRGYYGHEKQAYTYSPLEITL